jgi:hypothetical protein
MPAPASFAATRTASPSGSGPDAAGCGCLRGSALGRAGPVRAAAAFGRPPWLRALVAFAVFARPAVRFAPPEDFFAAPPELARLSLRRPGRERGRFPITPGSSVTSVEYERGLTIPCASCLEIRLLCA